MMSAKLTSQPTVGTAPSRTNYSRMSNSSRNDSSTSGVDVSSRRRLQKSTQNGGQTDPPTFTSSIASKNSAEARMSMMGRGRPSNREQKTWVQGAQDSSIKRNPPGIVQSGIFSAGTGSESTRNQSTGNNNSRLSVRMLNTVNTGNCEINPTAPENGDFLTPINFDDFHNSIIEDSLSHFPMPGHGGSGYDDKSSTFTGNSSWSSSESIPVAGKVTRTGSTRRQSDVGRLNSTNSMLPPPAPNTRSRRQSHAPTSLSNTATSRLPRQSIGPGTSLDRSSSVSHRRRPSVTARKTSAESGRPDQGNSFLRPRQRDSDSNRSDDSKLLSTPRNLKAKSLQPPSREAQENFLAPCSTTEHSRCSSTNALQTPAKCSPSRAPTPSSSTKRMSIMPHATGLGARTISPTDARRMKRMSVMPLAPPIPNTPPVQSDLSLPRPRSSAQSPSLIPRKSVTPSSSRTTPDLNRKSYSSGISLSSNTSYNSVRNSSGSLQPRPSQNIPSSRLPTPKPRMENMNGSNEEEVPPVPAIPKAYESPKMEFEPSSAGFRKSSVPVDFGRLAIGSNSKRGSDLSDETTPDDSTFVSASKGVRAPEIRQKQIVNIGKKNLQPLRLPPLNLLPLSTPLVAKIDALKDGDRAKINEKSYTPPPYQTTTKTPSTPMTASKAAFFYNHGDQDVPPVHHFRSSTSHFVASADQTGFRAPSSSSAVGSLDIPVGNRTVSPYISASLPKNSGEFMRNKAGGEYSRGSWQHGKLTGPRPQTQVSILSTSNETGGRVSSPVDLEKDGSALRSKLSLALKHSNLKSQLVLDTNVDPAKYDNMPPPRLPASATSNNYSTSRSSPTLKSSYLRSRRKSSMSGSTSASVIVKNPSFNSEQDLSPSTDSGDVDSLHHRPGSILSPVHKILNSAKSNAGNKRPVDPNLDPDDLAAEEEMRKLGSKRKDFEVAAKVLDELRRRASPKERVSPVHALRMTGLNIFERGEIMDFKDIFFCGTQKARKHVGDLKSQSANFGYDDERGDYQIAIGDHLAYRYEIVDVLGKGSFGQVVRCVDHKTGGLVAVKIIRNKKRFHQQALVEVNILQKLKEWDPHRRHSVVNFTQSFYFRGHLCISTELLGMNLYEFIKAHEFRGFSLKLIRRFTKQLISTLVLLHSKKVIHCDLKPENILLVHPLHSEIRVIDFGSSCFEHEKVYTYIQSRFYRSPEVILGMSYGMPIDMWSLGCILAELYTGYPIFPGENEQEQLACIMEVFGPPEKHLIDKSTRKKLFFDSLGKPRLTVSSKGRRRRPSSKDLKQTLKCDDEPFLDFIGRCLRWDPARRLNPNDALNHEFITGIKPSFRSRSHVTVISSSPAKRLTRVTTPSSTRPLPEPPATSVKNGSIRNRDTSNNSPVKMTGPKRHSTMNGLPPAASNRVSNTSSFSSSGLPRVSTRSTSGKPDLAAAAAVTSLKTR